MEPEPIPFASDFAERVLREAKRTRISSRRRRTFAGVAAMAIAVVALVGVGRGPLQVGQARPQPAAPELVAINDWEAADSEILAEEDADADPDSYLIPELVAQVDEAVDADGAILGQE